jgi:hypothetical protein
MVTLRFQDNFLTSHTWESALDHADCQFSSWKWSSACWCLSVSGTARRSGCWSLTLTQSCRCLTLTQLRSLMNHASWQALTLTSLVCCLLYCQIVKCRLDFCSHLRPIWYLCCKYVTRRFWGWEPSRTAFSWLFRLTCLQNLGFSLILILVRGLASSYRHHKAKSCLQVSRFAFPYPNRLILKSNRLDRLA